VRRIIPIIIGKTKHIQDFISRTVDPIEQKFRWDEEIVKSNIARLPDSIKT